MLNLTDEQQLDAAKQLLEIELANIPKLIEKRNSLPYGKKLEKGKAGYMAFQKMLRKCGERIEAYNRIISNYNLKQEKIKKLG